MGTNEHDWRTKDYLYVSEDAELSNPDSYEWSEPPGDDQHIITRGIARKGARVNVMAGKAEIKMGREETLEVLIKEPEPTAIFLNESRSAWERRQNLLAEEREIIRETHGFSTDTKEFDFLQASQTAVIMAIAALECYANHKLNTEGKSQKSITEKVNNLLPDITSRKKPSTNADTKDLWQKFQDVKKLRDKLIHATAKNMERVNVHKPEWVNSWEKTARIGCPHEIALKLIEYFEDDSPEWLKRFPHAESWDENTDSPQ